MSIDLRPSSDPIYIPRKDSVSFGWDVEDEATGDPIDFTGTTVTLTVSTRRDGRGVDLFTLTPDALDATGALDFQPSATDTDLPVGTYYYDLEWVYGSSTRTLVKDVFVVSEQITD